MTVEESTDWLVTGWEQAYKRLAYAYFGKMPDAAHKRMMYCRERAGKAQSRWEAVRSIATKQREGVV